MQVNRLAPAQDNGQTVDPQNKRYLEANETSVILSDIAALNRGKEGRLGLSMDAYRIELFDRAEANDGVVSPRERELIDKAVDGSLTPSERAELIKLLPAKGPEGLKAANEARGKSNQELLDEVRDIHQVGSDEMATRDYEAIRELMRRAAADGKMSAELDTLFHKLRYGNELDPAEFERFRQLLQEEDNLV